jgi:hypothetical protein
MTGFAGPASGGLRRLLKTPKAKIPDGEQKANTYFASCSPLAKPYLPA